MRAGLRVPEGLGLKGLNGEEERRGKSEAE